MAHACSPFASLLAFSRKFVSASRLEVGQLILTTRGMSFPLICHLSDVALSTTVDLPIIAGSREITSPSFTLNPLRPSFSGKTSLLPSCTTYEFAILFCETILAFLGTWVSIIPFCSSERQWKAIIVAMNFVLPSSSAKLIAEDTRITDRLA